MNSRARTFPLSLSLVFALLAGLGASAPVAGAQTYYYPPPANVVPITPFPPSTVCSRRAISLVRADVQGKRIKLSGLVGNALYGKKVTIQTDPGRASSSKFTNTTSVTASSKNGTFVAYVRKPKQSIFKSVRYRAKSGAATSPKLKLPQSLTSRSVNSASPGTITVRGQVKKSLLGKKRNKVIIRRLVCGRYTTVGSARPSKNGNYTITFNSTDFSGVALYRAESKVLRGPKSGTYVTQYARAIAIALREQTG